jgi:CO dehydrogenase maturation factor
VFDRRIAQYIDRILLVVEPSFDSLLVAERIQGLAAGIKKKPSAVLNKITSEAMALKLRVCCKQRA